MVAPSTAAVADHLALVLTPVDLLAPTMYQQPTDA